MPEKQNALNLLMDDIQAELKVIETEVFWVAKELEMVLYNINIIKENDCER